MQKLREPEHTIYKNMEKGTCLFSEKYYNYLPPAYDS